MEKTFGNVILSRKSYFIPIISTLIFSSTALGVQRTILSVYSQGFHNNSQYIVMNAAIALSSYGGSKAIGNYMGGKLSKKFNRSLSIFSGVLVLLFGSIILVLFDIYWLFSVGNGLVGLGVGIIFASSTIALTDISTNQHRAKAVSSMELSVYLGTTFGSLNTGFVSETNIKSAYILALIFVIVTLAISLKISDTSHFIEAEDEIKFQSMHNKIIAVRKNWKTEIKYWNVSDIHKYENIFDPIVEEVDESISRLMPKQRSSRKRDLFFNPAFIAVFATGIISRIADATIIIVFPLLIVQYHYNSVLLGVITSLFTIFWAVGIAITGPISDRIGRKQPLVFGLFLEAFGYIILFFLGLNTWLPVIIIGTSIAGLGRGLYFPISTSIASELVPAEMKADALGIYRFFLDFGYVIGSILIVSVIDFRKIPIGSNVQIFEPTFYLLIILLLLQGLMSYMILVDPNPGYKQYPHVVKHFQLVQKSIINSMSCLKSYSLKKYDEVDKKLIQAKNYEREADKYLEKLTIDTYSGIFKATDAMELLNFSNRIDKVAGYCLRSIRKLRMIKEELSEKFRITILQYSVLLDLIASSAYETVRLLSIQMNTASIQSYQVNIVEELLDDIHLKLWRQIVEEQNTFSPLTLILLKDSIEHLEKGANTLEDAIQTLRMVTFKHLLK